MYIYLYVGSVYSISIFSEKVNKLKIKSSAGYLLSRGIEESVPLSAEKRIPTPVTRSLARNDSASRCSGRVVRPYVRLSVMLCTEGGAV